MVTAGDKLDWDPECDGRMRDFQTDDDAVFTIPYVDDAPVEGQRSRGIGLQLPAMLRSFGLTVELVPGWENRSAGSFDPHGAVCHWTAGSRTGDRGSLNVCIHGRPGLAGPLCNTFLCRSGVAVVVAAGRANHAGAGGWRGLSGNHQVWGTEAENSGYDAWTDAQRYAYPRINAAYARLSGFGADMCCGHSEWTPRKIDINNYTMTRMRAEMATLLAGTGDDMPTSEEVAAAVWKHKTAAALIAAVEGAGDPSGFALVREAGDPTGAVWLSNLVTRRWVRDGHDLESVLWWLKKWRNADLTIYDVEDLDRFGVPVGDPPPFDLDGGTP